jgi:hypothetical protein
MCKFVSCMFGEAEVKYFAKQYLFNLQVKSCDNSIST